MLIIRGGRLVDIARRNAEARDILVDGDTISAVVPAGAAAPPDAQVIDARGTFGGQLSRLLPSSYRLTISVAEVDGRLRPTETRGAT